MFPKTQDQTIDRLLAAQGRAPDNAASLCSTFDADLASAYVERRLSASETTGFEAHLVACPPCRKAIIALTRMALAEAEPARTDVAVERPPAVSPVRRWLGVLATPQWAVAAAAALVLAITLPLLLSHRATRDGQGPSAESSNAQAAATPPAAEPAQAPPNDMVAVSNAAPEAHEKSASATPSDKLAVSAAAAKDVAAGASAPAGAASGGAAAPAQPAEAKATDQTVAKNETQPAAPAPSPAAAEAPKSQEKEKKEVADDRKADKPATAQPARGEEADKAKSDSAVAADTIAPPPPPPARRTLRKDGDNSRSRRDGGFSGPASAFRSPSRESRVPSLKVGGHQFWLHEGTWTDREFDPAKGLPHTQVMRDSDQYRDLLARKEKIKPFLTEFPADARVIFVFDGTVYYLIPQKGEQ
ncbi:MAG TPA: zf-HC2 domain-containing protein [Blastocatellia bacterium]|nr:zf-HC2 domain-containing protein [Blastocatellia bacterium]